MPRHVVKRQEFLQKLESVQPGLSSKLMIEQGQCFVFRGGWVYTFNGDTSCKTPTGLPKEFVGAVKAKLIVDVISRMEQEEVEVAFTGEEIIIKGRGERAKFRLQTKIMLPLDQVDRPDKWLPLPPEFGEAMGVVQECAGKNASTESWISTCINFNPKFIEACDDFQGARFAIKTSLPEATIVKRDAVHFVAGLGMTEIAMTPGWLHFKNPAGLQLAAERHLDQYPDIGSYFGKPEGAQKLVLPKTLAKAAETAEKVSELNEDTNLLIVDLSPDRVQVKAVADEAEYLAAKRAGYTGPQMRFLIGPKTLAEVTKKHNECLVNPDKMLVVGGKYRYFTTLDREEEEATDVTPEQEEESPEGSSGDGYDADIPY